MNELKTAYIQQTDNGQEKSDWIVLNAKKEEIYKLPKDMNEKHAMAAIHLGRAFEVKAFNSGINFQKNLVPQKIIDLQKIVKQLSEEKEALLAENDKISTEIDKLIFKE